MPAHLTALTTYLRRCLGPEVECQEMARNCWVLAVRDYEPSDAATKLAWDMLCSPEGGWMRKEHVRAAIKAALQHDAKVGR